MLPSFVLKHLRFFWRRLVAFSSEEFHHFFVSMLCLSNQLGSMGIPPPQFSRSSWDFQPLGSGENHQDVRNQLRKSTRTYKDKGVLATLEIIISYIHICICMYYSYRSAIATSSSKPIADITHWSGSCFGWDRRSSLPAGSTHAAQESIFYPRTELMWDAKKDTEAVLQVGRLVQDALIGYL